MQRLILAPWATASMNVFPPDITLFMAFIQGNPSQVNLNVLDELNDTNAEPNPRWAQPESYKASRM